jgi:hypothetical protein
MDVKLGLTNKTTGIVRKIVKSIDPKDPPIILVYFEGYKGMDIMYDEEGQVYPNVVPIKVFTQSGKDNIKRENFPLKLAFANTIHFAQGSTTKKLAVFFGDTFKMNSELL